MQEKRCPTCGETKPITEFHRNKARADGVQSHCRMCRRTTHIERPPQTEKRCIECGETKSANQFYRLNTRLSSRCKICFKADMHRRWRAKHPEPLPYVKPTEKRCTRCGEIKPLGLFYRAKEVRDGRQSQCAKCMSEAANAWNKTHRKRHTQLAKEYYHRNSEERAEYELLRRLGMSPGTYGEMLTAQNGKCAICKTDTPGSRLKRFAVDHCDITGQIRGLLCSRCNFAIGGLGHDIATLEAAIEYLQASLKSAKSSGV